MTFDGVGGNMERRASPPVEADAPPAAGERTPGRWRKKEEEDTLTSFQERTWAGEDARRSIRQWRGQGRVDPRMSRRVAAEDLKSSIPDWLHVICRYGNF